tara:strand:+ start:2137 stop:2457 length:321 start_codon:yes stop_codon:yes gene_type:complete
MFLINKIKKALHVNDAYAHTLICMKDKKAALVASSVKVMSTLEGKTDEELFQEVEKHQATILNKSVFHNSPLDNQFHYYLMDAIIEKIQNSELREKCKTTVYGSTH